ncbi:hypothetical protein GCM10027265_34270 [Jatrophihabitans fulvus]
MIVVTSAAGGVGRPLVRALAQHGEKVRALVKNEAQARASEQDGAVEVVVGDLRTPGDLETAVRGARAIYHAAPTRLIDEVPIAERLVAAARSNGGLHVVFHSVVHPDIEALTHHQQKLRVEWLLRGSGLPVTVLRPSHYMQNYLEVWDFLLAGVMPYPVSPDSVMGVVDVEDVAEVAAAVLRAPDEHVGETYDLSAQELTRHEMARDWAAVLGHDVTAVRLPPRTLLNPLAAATALGGPAVRSLVATRLRSAPHLLRGVREARNARDMSSWPAEARQNYMRMMAYYDEHGLPAGDLATLPRLLGRPATSYRAFAQRTRDRMTGPAAS